MLKLVHVTNVINPSDKYAYSLHILMRPIHDLRSDIQIWNDHIKWVDKFIKGNPKATETYSTEELLDQGLIGLYKTIDE